MISTNDHMFAVKEMISTCEVDIRDEWPTNPTNYAKSIYFSNYLKQLGIN